MVRLSNHTNLKNKITDADIIKILMVDGRRTFVEIAKDLEVLKLQYENELNVWKTKVS
ncbi:MAG: AsnC family protein [Candidatus Heimdallarchaeota archaeon]|nr:AsnC family protein [Candidatus Heimdallarchaeota archaeon]